MGWKNWKPIKDRDDDYYGPACYELGFQSPNGTIVDTVLVGATENETKCIGDLISTLHLPQSVFQDESTKNKPKIFVYHTWRFGNKNEAIDLMYKTLRKGSEDEYPWFPKYTMKLYNLGRFPEFLENAKFLISVCPEDAELLEASGCALQKLGRNKDALKCFEDALNIDPHCESPRRHRDEILNQLKKTDGEPQNIRSKNPEKIRNPSEPVREYYEIGKETGTVARPVDYPSSRLRTEDNYQSSKKSFEHGEQQQTSEKTQGAAKQIEKPSVIQHPLPDNSQRVDPKSTGAIPLNEPEIDIEFECPIIESGTSEIVKIIICNKGEIPYRNFVFEFPDERFGINLGNRMSLVKSGETKTTDVEIFTKIKFKGKILFKICVTCEDEKNNAYSKISTKPITIIEQDSTREDHPSSPPPSFSPVINVTTQTSNSKTTFIEKMGNDVSIGGDAVITNSKIGAVPQESLNKPSQSPQKQVVRCRKCNADLDPTEQFCNRCGEKVRP